MSSRAVAAAAGDTVELHAETSSSSEQDGSGPEAAQPPRRIGRQAAAAAAAALAALVILAAAASAGRSAWGGAGRARLGRGGTQEAVILSSGEPSQEDVQALSDNVAELQNAMTDVMSRVPVTMGVSPLLMPVPAPAPVKLVPLGAGWKYCGSLAVPKNATCCNGIAGGPFANCCAGAILCDRGSECCGSICCGPEAVCCDGICGAPNAKCTRGVVLAPVIKPTRSPRSNNSYNP